MKYNNIYLVCDVETGGLPDKLKKQATHEVALTEIAFVAIDSETLEIVDQKSWLFKPYRPDLIYEQEAVQVSGISLDFLKENGLEMKEAFKDILKFLSFQRRGKNLPKLVGHNIKNFDLAFITGLFELNEVDITQYFNGDVYDTMDWARDKWIDGRFNLQSVCQRFGIEHVSAHRALPDTIATAKVFIKFIQLLRAEQITEKKEKFRDTFKFEI